MAAIRLVAALREENRRVGEGCRVGAVQCGRKRVHLRLEDVHAFQHARRAILQVTLQYAMIDELYLPLLDYLVDARVREVDGLPCLEEIEVVEVEQRIVQVTAEVLEREELLIGDQIRSVHMGDVARRAEALLEVEVADASLDGREFHCRLR